MVNPILYGSREPLPERVPLRAGPLSLVYEAGDLRYIRLGGREVLRRLYVAVRDRNWGTVPALLSEVEIAAEGEAFRITYRASHEQGLIDFRWQGTIEGRADGTIAFDMDGTAASTFLRNRIGICVLHPSEAAGAACVVEHVDGRRTEGRLPTAISPHQPFKDMRAISHEVLPGCWARVQMEGDTYEMEDQRNWTDASFKTYSTPLELPFPVEIRAGDRVHQTVKLTLGEDCASAPAAAREAGAPVTLALGEPLGPLPELGLGAASHGQPLTEREVALLRALRLGHLRVEIDLGDPHWTQSLGAASRDASALGLPLQLAVIAPPGQEDRFEALAAEVARRGVAVSAWLLFTSRATPIGAEFASSARELLARHGLAGPLGSGALAHFTELNRVRPPAEALDLVSYSITPQMHAFDNASLVETLPMQAVTLANAREIGDGLPVHVSPVTLRPRFNAVATAPEADAPAHQLPPEVDPRQMSLFGAGWTLSSLKYLAEAGAASVSLYETAGWRGVLERVEGSPLPELFPSRPGHVYPLYHVLRFVGALGRGDSPAAPSRDARVVRMTSADPLACDGLAIRAAGGLSLAVANLESEPRTVRIEGLEGIHADVHLLDETTAEFACRDPQGFWERPPRPLVLTDGMLEIRLPAYAAAFIRLPL